MVNERQDSTTTRREFLFAAAIVAIAPVGYLWRRTTRGVGTGAFQRAATNGGGVTDTAIGGAVEAAEVTIVEFSDAGERQRTVRVPKVVKPDEEWRKQLSPLAFQVARRGDTERPFTGAYWDLHEKGFFRCVCCDVALFSSAAKFDSGTGWPSFWQPIAKENVVTHPSRSSFYVESELTCPRCDAHLGDVFNDGPKPTGLRYCIDSVSLRFIKTA